MRHCLYDPTFSHFGTILACDGQMDRHRTHHSASVTVLGCKACCEKHKCTYLLTYRTTAYGTLAQRNAVKIKHLDFFDSQCIKEVL